MTNRYDADPRTNGEILQILSSDVLPPNLIPHASTGTFLTPDTDTLEGYGGGGDGGGGGGGGGVEVEVVEEEVGVEEVVEVVEEEEVGGVEVEVVEEEVGGWSQFHTGEAAWRVGGRHKPLAPAHEATGPIAHTVRCLLPLLEVWRRAEGIRLLH
ncbi:unnamed protein product [Merluccius merluccius]